jgi:hypothetical protein
MAWQHPKCLPYVGKGETQRSITENYAKMVGAIVTLGDTVTHHILHRVRLLGTELLVTSVRHVLTFFFT